MKKMLLHILYTGICGLIVFGLGFMVGYDYGSGDAKVEIKEVKVVETKFIKVPQNSNEAMKCAMSPIRIEAKVIDDKTIAIKASDECKETTANISIEARTNIERIRIVGIAGFVTGVLFVSLILMII